MSRQRYRSLMLGLAVMFLAALAPLALSLGPLAQAAPNQQGATDSWTRVGSSAQRLHSRAAAMDTENHHLYVFGGMTNNGQEDNLAETIDFSGMLNQVSARALRINAQDRWGSAGAFRPDSANDEGGGDPYPAPTPLAHQIRPQQGMTDTVAGGKVYFFGGMDTGLSFGRPVDQARAQDDIIMVDVVSGSSRELRIPGAFGERALAIAAYVPDHDVIVVQGGTERCALRKDPTKTPTPTNTPVVAGAAEPAAESDSPSRLFTSVECESRDTLRDTWYLTFSDSGDPSWMRGPNGPSLMMHAAALDPISNTLYVYGGTDDAQRSKSDLWALDMSDTDDLGAATWSRVATDGSGPGTVSLHGMAMDEANRRLIVYGGVRSFPFGDNENVAQNATWALDLNQNPPAWSNLGTQIGTRISPLMAYDSNNGVVVMAGGRNRWNEQRQSTFGDIYVLERSEDGGGANPTPGVTEPAPPSVTPGGPTLTPAPPPPQAPGEACPIAQIKVPAAVLNAAVAAPASVYGYNLPCNPSLPTHPLFNPIRNNLSIRNESLPYHPLFNGLIWKCGCP